MIIHDFLNYREDIIKFVNPIGVGIELGVAEGEFSERVLNKTTNYYHYSVDMWAGDRGHDDEQYKRVIKRLETYRNRNTIIKLKFSDAINLFPDDYFDFIYVDGYAHTGEENGKTFLDWYPKLKKGGILAGDDYHDNWPLVKKTVDSFCNSKNKDINVINCHEPNSIWSEYPTWFIFK